jgi:hypothetical protein
MGSRRGRSEQLRSARERDVAAILALEGGQLVPGCRSRGRWQSPHPGAETGLVGATAQSVLASVGSTGWVVWCSGSVGLGGGEFVGFAAGAVDGDFAGGLVEDDPPALVVGEAVVD